MQISSVEHGSSDRTSIEADYSVTKDCVIYGIVYGVNSADSDTTDQLTDQPFCFRFRVDDNVLTIKDVKGFGEGKQKEMAGRYTRVDKKTAAAKGPGDDVKRYYPTPAEPPANPSVGIKETRSKD